MEFIRLGTFCQIINNSLFERINSDFEFKKNQESVVTMTLRILSYDSNDELDEKYNGEDGDKILDKPYCSKICKGTEKIHLSLLKFLQKDDYIERISTVEGQFSSIEDDAYFSKSVACRKILELFTSPTYKIIEFIENPHIENRWEIDVNQLEELYKNKEYDRFLATSLVFIATYISNLDKKHQPELQEIASLPEVSSEMFDSICRGRCFDSFRRKIRIIPRKATKDFLIKSETVFESKFVNPRLMEDGKLTYSFSFETKEEAENHHLKVMINGEDLEVHSRLDTSCDSVYPYKLIHSVHDIPHHRYYEVKLEVEQIRKCPVFQTSYRLTAPCKSFKVDVSVIGEDKDDWVTSFNMFSQAKYRDSKHNRINTIPGSNADSVDINQWISERTGYSLNVRPKRDKWLDYIPAIDKT